MRRILASLVVMLSLAGCALPGVITPETPREKLVVAEAAYEVVLLQIKSLINNGIIRPRTGVSGALATFVKESRSALDAWHTDPDDLSFERATRVALASLQRYLTTLIPTQESSYEPGYSYRHPARAFAA